MSAGAVRLARTAACTLWAVSSEPAADLDPADTAATPRQSRVATAALVIGVVAIPFGLLVYPGLLFGLLALGVGIAGLVITRNGRALRKKRPRRAPIRA